MIEKARWALRNLLNVRNEANLTNFISISVVYGDDLCVDKYFFIEKHCFASAQHLTLSITEKHFR